ncbi:hypothetical protein F2P56_021681, partial [Juglans regia]
MKANGSCKNHFSKGFVPNTTVGIDCFPQYKRCDNGMTVKIRGKDLDNRWVVPHNPYLHAKFDCHLNVEICSTIKAVKYLYKYIYKGHDRVAFNLIPGQNIQDIDEIQQFQSARWIAPPEAMWRIYGFILNEMYQSVYSLHLHLEYQHLVAFHAHDNLNNVLRSDFTAKSMLTEFFSTNQTNENARKLLYKEFPEAFVWNQQHKIWTPRKKKSIIGRIVTASPFEGERYYLQILLNHIRGPLSFDHIKTVGNVTAPTFREAATLHVYSLHLHLEYQHLVAFHAHDNLNNVLRSDFTAKSMLTEFFSTNQTNENARKLLYKEFPEAFVWNQQHKIWTPRKKKSVIGRIVTASPFEGERYYLQILLNHIRGPLSFDHIKTVGNVTAPTFREAATLH